ncbi:Protein WBSCR14 -like protein, partial [Trichinella spiralis]
LCNGVINFEFYFISSCGLFFARFQMYSRKVENSASLMNKMENIIHSGQFMSSHVHENKPEEEEEIDIVSDSSMESSSELMPDVADANPVTFYKFGPKTSQSIAIDTSLTKLNRCIQIVYQEGKLITPKWKNFQGLKIAWADRVRLNNVIWRAWYIQFVENVPPKYCFFSIPEEDWHKKPQIPIVEGMFWKRRTETITSQYMRWRRFFLKHLHKRRSHKSESPTDLKRSFDEHDSLFNFRPTTPLHSNTAFEYDDLNNWFTDTLFSSLNQPYLFPNPKEMAQAGNADIIQPGLIQLQPSLEEIMGTLDSGNGLLSCEADLPLLMNISSCTKKHNQQEQQQHASTISTTAVANENNSNNKNNSSSNTDNNNNNKLSYVDHGLLIDYDNAGRGGQSTSYQSGSGATFEYSNSNTTSYCEPYMPQMAAAGSLNNRVVQYSMAKTWADGAATTPFCPYDEPQPTAGDYFGQAVVSAHNGPSDFVSAYSVVASSASVSSSACSSSSPSSSSLSSSSSANSTTASVTVVAAAKRQRSSKAKQQPQQQQGRSLGTRGERGKRRRTIQLDKQLNVQPENYNDKTVLGNAELAELSRVACVKDKLMCTVSTSGEAKGCCQSSHNVITSSGHVGVGGVGVGVGGYGLQQQQQQQQQQHQQQLQLQLQSFGNPFSPQSCILRPIPISLGRGEPSAFTSFNSPSSNQLSPLGGLSLSPSQSPAASCALGMLGPSTSGVASSVPTPPSPFNLTQSMGTIPLLQNRAVKSDGSVVLFPTVGSVQVPLASYSNSNVVGLSLPTSSICSENLTNVSSNSCFEPLGRSSTSAQPFEKLCTELHKTTNNNNTSVTGPVMSQDGSKIQLELCADSSADRNERKRMQHLQAEQYRRSALKEGFDILEELVFDGKLAATTRPTNAMILNQAASEIRSLRKVNVGNEKMIDAMKAEVEKLNAKISAYQRNLASSHQGVVSTNSFEDVVRVYMKQKFQKNWKLWLLWQLVQPLYESYRKEVTGQTSAEMMSSVQEWLAKHCNPTTVRPALSALLVRLATDSPILTNPQQFQLWIGKIVSEMQQ